MSRSSKNIQPAPADPRPRGFFRALIPILFLLIPALLLPGCGATTDSGASGDTGQVIIGLTDADGDFLSYTVDVVSLSLTRANGDQVQTLPLSTRVDFAQYTELTEFLTAATVPNGAYTAATMTLDYTDADIQVERNGQAVPAVVKDEDGDPVGTIEVSVKLDNARRLIVAPGVPAHLTLDFDLAASNSVDTSVDPPVVTLEPVLIADVEPEGPKPHRVRGLLASVDEAASSFEVIIRPFFHRSARFGEITVSTDAETEYEIDGVPYAGAEGLARLAEMAEGTPVVARGSLQCDPFRFLATEVLAGSSVPWHDTDAVQGSVTARSGNTLTVRGATVVRANTSVVFDDDITVTVGPDTLVTRQAAWDGSFTIDDISVGQRVRVFGRLSGDTAGELSMDATDGRVRMLTTTLRGLVVSTDAGLVLDLQSINGRRISLFDFSGTGATDADDADPGAYEVETGTLDLSGLTAGEPVKVLGFVSPFGEAPPDFLARTIVDPASARTAMHVLWMNKGTDAAFSGIGPDGLRLALDPDALGPLHHVREADMVTDLLDLPNDPSILPEESGTGLFALHVRRGPTQVYRRFDDFQEALSGRLDEGALVKYLRGSGAFDYASAGLTANRVAVKLY